MTASPPRRNRPVTWDERRFPEKVQPWHRDRLAVSYVRQSMVQQVLDHQDSTRLPYGLTTQAMELGWAATRVVVIEDDLAESGTSAEGRAGFQRLVSEVSLDHVGIILGVEMSRLAAPVRIGTSSWNCFQLISPARASSAPVAVRSAATSDVVTDLGDPHGGRGD
jgi:hypothetical protein